MTAIEVALLLIGVVFILGSFFIIEKLSPTELSRVSELSEEELRIVMDRELEVAGAKISDMADQSVDLSMNQIQRRLEKDTNEKIMAISEYSATVLEKLQKTNKEVTFLYSMLGDKHTELNECMQQLNGLILECKAMQEQVFSAQQQYQMPPSRPLNTVEVTVTESINAEPEQNIAVAAEDELRSETETAEVAQADESLSVRDEILERYRNGESLKDIARNLGLGYGEVKLIVELYKGENNL